MLWEGNLGIKQWKSRLEWQQSAKEKTLDSRALTGLEASYWRGTWTMMNQTWWEINLEIEKWVCLKDHMEFDKIGN